ncbi:MAG: DUF1566 domain-containing protein [Calditrichia bacterium]
MKSYFQILLFFVLSVAFLAAFFTVEQHRKNNRFELDSVKQVVYDHGNKLVWQQSGSTDLLMGGFCPKSYVDSLNSIAFGGYTDWRLPTKSEAQSLITSEVKRGDELQIDPVFDTEQAWIYTNETDQAECRPLFISPVENQHRTYRVFRSLLSDWSETTQTLILLNLHTRTNKTGIETNQRRRI